MSADVAGVLTALCVSTKALSGDCFFVEKLIRRLSPLAAFVIMPVFALANTAVAVKAVSGAPGAGPARASRDAAHRPPRGRREAAEMPPR